MTNTPFMRKKLRAGTALQALALLGAGIGASAAFVAPANAQDFQNVTASGKVQGTNGLPIGGATVAITSNAQGFTRTTTTSADGTYRVAQLPIGTYTFTISADGYDTFTDSNVPLSLNAGGNTFTLAGGAAASSGEIVVTAGRTTVSSLDQTTTGAVIKIGELANRVPVSRSLTSVIRLTPGTAAGDSSFGDLPSISGSSVGENQYFVNGLNVTDFRNFLGSNSVPFEFYDTVDVKDGGYPAEFGRATGGFVSATTKSGSNEFHAGVVVTYEPAGLKSHQPNTFSSDNDADSSSDLRSDFYISGPIIKDHLFFYGLYEARQVKSSAASDREFDYTGPLLDAGGVPRLNPNTRSRSYTNSPFFAAKVDAVITDGQRLEFTYFRTTGQTRVDQYCYRYTDNADINCQSTNTGEYNQAPYVGSQIQQYGGDNFVGRYTGSFTDWLTISAAYGQSENRENDIASKQTPLVLDNRNAALGQVTISPNPGYFQTINDDKREFYRGDVDIYAHLLGSHHFRFGVDHETLTTTGITNYSSGFYYQIFHTTSASICGGPGGCDYIRGRDLENGGSFNTYNQAYYAEDSWSLFNDRLTLNLGIRNDRFKNNNVADVTYYKSGNQWGPRLGFTYDVFGDKRTKVYGSFSRYFLPIAANTNIRLGGAEYDVYSYYKFGGLNSDGTPILGTPIVRPGHCIRPDPTYNVTNNCTVAQAGEVADTASTVSQNLKPQSEDEYILGFEQKFGSRWTVGAYFTYRKLNDALEDSAIDAAARRYCEDQGFAAADCSYIYQGFSQYVLNNPGRPITVQLAGLPDGSTPVVTLTDIGYPSAKRHYKGVTFKFDREFDGKWELHGSYTYSKAIGNYEGSVTSDNGQTDAGLTQDFDQPQLTEGAYGYLPNHHLHNLKVYGSYQLFDWLNLGANLAVQSPRKFGCFGLLPTGAGTDPFNAIINSAYGAAARYCPYKDGKVDDANPVVQVRRGTGPQSDWFTELDLTAAVKVPTDAFDAVVRFDVFNVFNSHAVTDLYEFGTTDGGAAQSAIYGKPTGYQEARFARVQLQLRF